MAERRKVIVTENISANGVIEFVDRWFDPGDTDDRDLLAVAAGHMETEDTLLLGRETFEDFRGYWPLQTNDVTGSTAHLNRVHKYVFSSTMDDPGWENTTVRDGPVEDEVRALRDLPGGDIGVTGSISVVHALMRADLVDEYRLFVYPVLAGRGRYLVPEGLSMSKLKLVESQAFRSGVVLLNYSR